MNPVNLPELPAVAVDGLVALSAKELDTLVSAVNALIDTANRQQTVIFQLDAELKSCREDISKIATILEELYNEV